MLVKAVVFDLDGTLYGYEECHRHALGVASNVAHGLFGLKKEEFDCLFHEARKIVNCRLEGSAASHNRLLYFQTLLEIMGENPIKEALTLYDAYWNAFLSVMQSYPYVVPLMGRLKQQGITIGILTDLTAHIQHRKLQRLTLDSYIDVLVTSEEVGADKPDSRTFELVLSKLKMLPKDVLMIGDSQKKDIAGAGHIGMESLFFSSEKKESMYSECLKFVLSENEKGVQR